MMNIKRLNDDLKVLSEMTPIAMVENALWDIAGNNVFERENAPFIKIFKPIEEESNDGAIRKHWPQFFFYVLNKDASRFKFAISFYDCEFLPSGQSSIKCLKKSAFSSWFKACDWLRYEAVLEMDILTAARFLTYYLRIFGYDDFDDLEILKKMVISKGDMSLLRIPQDVTIPLSLKGAIEKLQELKISANDNVSIVLSQINSEISIQFDMYYDENGYTFILYNEFSECEMELRRSYRNFDCFTFGYMGDGYESIRFTVKNADDGMRLLTDFFLSVYPKVKGEEIMASIVLSGNEKIFVRNCTSNEFHFFSDGSEDTPEALTSFIDAVGRRRTEDEETNEDIKNMDNLGIGGEYDDQIKNTVALDEVADSIKKLSCYTYIDVYDRDSLNMVFELKERDLEDEEEEIYRWDIYCYIILKPGQIQAFENVSAYDYLYFSDLDDGNRLVELRFRNDIWGAAKYITYFMNVLRYDIPSIRFEVVNK